MSTVAAISKREGVNPDEGKQKYGSVRFADEKNKKYPIDTAEHARAAWSYINMPKNAAKYSSGDLATIKGKIRAACKRFGITTASQITVTSEYSVALDGELPTEVMYMPAGRTTINPSVNGEPRKIDVTVTQHTADLMQAELDKLLAENVRPYIDFDHKGGAAAAIPKAFKWKEGEGVLLELDWTGAGKNAVGGRDYSYFSPTFLLNENGDPSGLPKSGSIGALTNNPAFREIRRISASMFDGYFDHEGHVYFWNEEGVTDSHRQFYVPELAQLIAATTGDESTKRKGNKHMETEIEAALRTEVANLQEEVKALREEREAAKVEAANREADQLIEAAVNAGKIAPKNETAKAGLKKLILTDPQGAKAFIDAIPQNPAFKTIVKVTGEHRSTEKDSSKMNLNSGELCRAKVLEVQAQNKGMSWQDAWDIARARHPELFTAAA